jgi:hypothetical protein
MSLTNFMKSNKYTQQEIDLLMPYLDDGERLELIAYVRWATLARRRPGSRWSPTSGHGVYEERPALANVALASEDGLVSSAQLIPVLDDCIGELLGIARRRQVLRGN